MAVKLARMRPPGHGEHFHCPRSLALGQPHVADATYQLGVNIPIPTPTKNLRNGPTGAFVPLSRPSAHIFMVMSGLSRAGRGRSGQMSRVRGHVRIATGGTESERAEDSGWKLGDCRDGNICATFMTIGARLHGDVRGVFFLAPFF